MSDILLPAAVAFTLLILLAIAVYHGWLTKGEAGLWAAFVAGVVTIWHEMRSESKGAQHPLSPDETTPDDVGTTYQHTTTPEPSYESDPSDTPRDVRDADSIDDYVRAVDRAGTDATDD